MRPKNRPQMTRELERPYITTAASFMLTVYRSVRSHNPFRHRCFLAAPYSSAAAPPPPNAPAHIVVRLSQWLLDIIDKDSWGFDEEIADSFSFEQFMDIQKKDEEKERIEKDISVEVDFEEHESDLYIKRNQNYS
ncbi:hypothetical protein EVAR_63205_1 [Eumeta japonica]|uniref:Uncharacterized protein n=1 Tax=Eumeta variegata TaxID=151549 RepID=A0A4C1ZLR8_EUMVA|nr:hypothetical protein EVAR_63205_1 [Eumeta japonica]